MLPPAFCWVGSSGQDGGTGRMQPCVGSKDSSPSTASPEILIAPHFAQTVPSNIYWCALELQVWPYSPDGQAGVISALLGTLFEAPEQAGVIWCSLLRAGSTHATTWHAHAGSSSSAVDGSSK